MAIKTIFGWLIGGDTQVNEDSQNKEMVYPCYYVGYEDINTNKLLNKFFEQEVLTQEEPSHAAEDQQAIDLFNKSTTRKNDGRYKVR